MPTESRSRSVSVCHFNACRVGGNRQTHVKLPPVPAGARRCLSSDDVPFFSLGQCDSFCVI